MTDFVLGVLCGAIGMSLPALVVTVLVLAEGRYRRRHLR